MATKPTTDMAVTHPTASRGARARLPNTKYAVHANRHRTASTSPNGLHEGVVDDPNTTMATPTSATAAQPASDRRTRSPNNGPATNSTNAGCNAEIIVA